MSTVQHFLFFAACVALFSCPARAADDSDDPWSGALYREEPNGVISSYTVDKNSFQIDSAFYSLFSRSGVQRSDFQAVYESFRGGVTDRLELRMLSLAPEMVRTTNPSRREIGISDLQAGLKWRATEGDGCAVPSTGFLATVTAPTGTGVFNARHWQGSVTPALDWTLPWKFNVSTNLNVTLAADREGHFPQFYPYAYVDRPINSRLSWYGEFYGAVPSFDRAHSSANMDGGISWYPVRRLRIDYTLGVGLDNRTRGLPGVDFQFNYVLNKDRRLQLNIGRGYVEGVNVDNGTYVTLGFSVRWGGK